MAKLQVYQNNFLSGVLDPRASGRTDTDAYQSGMRIGRNITPHHLGGVRRRSGLEFLATLPTILARVDHEITITVPHGDSDTVPANANDGDLATTITAFNPSTTDPFVIVHYDLGSAEAIVFADVLAIVLSATGETDEIAIQYSTDNAIWTTLGTAFPTVNGVVQRDYRRGGAAVTAQYWRVAKIGGTDLTTIDITLSEFNLYTTAGAISNVRLFPFEISTEDRYLLVVTDQSGAIYKDGVLVTHIPLPFLNADLANIDGANLAETMALVHQNYEPRFVIREFDSENFQPEVMPFDTIPQFDFSDNVSPTPTSEVQKIVFASGWAQGNTFQIELGGARSASITYAGDSSADERSTTATNIARAVQGLFSVIGFTGVTCERTGTREYTVTFADASADTYDLMVVVPLSASVGATTTRTAAGTPRAEDAWSATRGWPRTVTFFESRMYFGGSRALQQSLFGSSVNNILDFDPVEGLDDEPIFVTLAGSQLNAITAIFGGRSLQLFTSGGEFRFLKDVGTPIVPSDAPVPQTQYGSAKVRPVSIDGSTIFVHRTRKAVRDFRFDFQQDAYDSLGVSSLASHLINGIVDLAAWNGSALDEIGLVFVVNADGTAAVLNSRKEAKIQAWTEWTTQGLFKAVAVIEEDVYFAARRTINGTDHLFLETLNPDCYSDCSTIQTQASDNVATGLTHLSGQLCRVRADGFVLISRTPSVGGTITCEQAVENVEVGLNFTTAVTPMPISALIPGGGPTLMTKQRIVEIRVKVRNTLGVLINGRTLADREFDIDNFDTAPTPFTGVLRLEESTNWDIREEKLVEITQVDPCPLEIQMIQTSVAVGAE